MLVRADSSASAGRRLGHNNKQRARAETRGRSRELIAGGRHERQIVLALANDRMFLAAATVGCRPSACASPTIPKQVGHNHLGFGCRQHARCRPAGDCRSAEPELGPTSPGSQSSRCRRQHRFATADVSGSMTKSKFELQRSGYAAAFFNPRLIEALRGGPRGRIAAAFNEWSSVLQQKVVIDWTMISNDETARQFGDRIGHPTKRTGA